MEDHIDENDNNLFAHYPYFLWLQGFNLGQQASFTGNSGTIGNKAKAGNK
jgi:hypothetical protein